MRCEYSANIFKRFGPGARVQMKRFGELHTLLSYNIGTCCKVIIVSCVLTGGNDRINQIIQSNLGVRGKYNFYVTISYCCFPLKKLPNFLSDRSI